MFSYLTICRKKRKISFDVRQQTRRPLLRALRRARADAGLTISELAKRAGVSRDTISNAEKGQHSLQATTLSKIAGALGRAPSDLLAEEEKLAPKAESRSSLEPSLFNGLEGEWQLGYEALTTWYDYLGLTLTRWEKLRRQFQDLANRKPDEARDTDDLYRAVVDSLEFFRAVDRFHLVVGGFDVPRFEATAVDAGTRELVWLIRARADKLRRITELFLEYNERLTEALEARQSAWARHEVEKFLEDVMKDEARTADVS
jgi:transcriptional regulator with XRE-family HTH domain